MSVDVPQKHIKTVSKCRWSPAGRNISLLGFHLLKSVCLHLFVLSFLHLFSFMSHVVLLPYHSLSLSLNHLLSPAFLSLSFSLWFYFILSLSLSSSSSSSFFFFLLCLIPSTLMVLFVLSIFILDRYRET